MGFPLTHLPVHRAFRETLQRLALGQAYRNFLKTHQQRQDRLQTRPPRARTAGTQEFRHPRALLLALVRCSRNWHTACCNKKIFFRSFQAHRSLQTISILFPQLTVKPILAEFTSQHLAKLGATAHAKLRLVALHLIDVPLPQILHRLHLPLFR